MTTLITLSKMSLMAMQYLNVPYVWGGDHPLKGFDCSGFVQRVLQDCEMYPKNKDRTAQGLYDVFVGEGLRTSIEKDALLFFGDDDKNISHIAIALTTDLMIEAGGGNSRTRTKEDAAFLQDARVRIKPINNRSDLIASFVIDQGVDYAH